MRHTAVPTAPLLLLLLLAGDGVAQEPARAPADTAAGGYGSCPAELDGPAGAEGVAWGDTLAAADTARARAGAATGSPRSLIRAGDQAARRGEHTVAYAAYAAAAARDAGYEALWKAARAAVDVGQDAGEDGSDGWYRVAEEWGRAAVEASPDHPEGHLQLAQALGSRALGAGVRERVRMSVEVRSEARATLAADSSYAGGWHVLGRWNAEVERLSGAARFFARTFLGGEVMSEASWEKAERFMARAAELEPGRVIHHLELGRIHRDNDSPRRAAAAFRRVLELPPRDYRDCVYQRDAREALAELDAGG